MDSSDSVRRRRRRCSIHRLWMSAAVAAAAVSDHFFRLGLWPPPPPLPSTSNTVACGRLHQRLPPPSSAAPAANAGHTSRGGAIVAGSHPCPYLSTTLAGTDGRARHYLRHRHQLQPTLLAAVAVGRSHRHHRPHLPGRRRCCRPQFLSIVVGHSCSRRRTRPPLPPPSTSTSTAVERRSRRHPQPLQHRPVPAVLGRCRRPLPLTPRNAASSNRFPRRPHLPLLSPTPAAPSVTYHGQHRPPAVTMVSGGGA